MRSEANKKKVLDFIRTLPKKVKGGGHIYFTGGASALLIGWRDMTVDIDLKSDPEPEGFFEAIAELKEEMNINLELASPDLFIPELPGWRDRSRLIEKSENLVFFHYDFFSQALAKLERGHQRDLSDVDAMLDRSLINKELLADLFAEIEPMLIRYPGIDIPYFKKTVYDFCQAQ